jgi:C_GCAxxG_C_C family probable redox protein
MSDNTISTAGGCFAEGCDCAEAVLGGMRDRLPFPVSDDVLRAAICLGGDGVGQAGFCGAFSGAMMTLGLFAGRSGAGVGDATMCRYAQEFGQRFVANFGGNSCRSLQVHGYGSAPQKSNCGRIVATTSAMLVEFLVEKNLLGDPSETA